MHPSLVFLLAFVALTVQAAPAGKSCVVDSFAASKNVADCATITIKSFTVPAGQTLALEKLKDGTVVNFAGDLVFGYKEWEGPLFRVSGASDSAKVTVNGNGHVLDGQGPLYWDGKGGNGGKTKPHPMVKLNAAGTVSQLVIKNTPAHAVSVGAKGALVIDRVTIDDSLGATKGGHNTDCFDVSSVNGLTIQNSICKNQDDCLALNDGKNVKFLNNQCIGGHGISIGSIKAGKHVDNVLIQGNTIKDNTIALRIKSYNGAKDASVSNIHYNDNHATGITKFGMMVVEDYTNSGETGKVDKAIPITNVNFEGKPSTIVMNGGQAYKVLCGKNTCTGSWNWSLLKISGKSKAGTSNINNIKW
ncbi:hypothetical protein AMAG_00139 [Allomyces macrogynus ATCC 38327]|uniref:endo-polygalacturonase n=1 Tax=Allomyces macrogynus (strain ATCC 38327) TaxID=578462 RepID=A0A0L0RVI2_ALLM3|nr:hypothetical protein AMAG_00139 [Allomyces macrogynus ATCC 38327]|eukprot:KNE54139.1 hypothetical protein AMAG_00139 [Allomyces macrogynus ATCC 38327]